MMLSFLRLLLLRECPHVVIPLEVREPGSSRGR
jgi:hypothetical protein